MHYIQKEYSMIRFIAVCTFVILFLILSIPLLIAEWIIGKFNPEVKSIFDYDYSDFTLEGYDPWPAIKGVVSV